MDLDLRIPVGMLFVLLGGIMVIFGLTGNPAIYAKSLGIDINLSWGIVELLFGSIMLVLGRSAQQPPTAPPLEETTPARRSGVPAATTRGEIPPAGSGRKPPVRHR